MRRLTRLHDEEDGVALILVLGALMIVTMLSAALVAAATTVTATTFHDQSRSQALAAANAGLAAATARISAQPYDGGGASNAGLTSCFTSSFVAQGATGTCPGQTDSLGSNGSYTYYVSPEMSSNASCGVGGSAAPCWNGHSVSSCTGYPVQASSPGLDLGQRCVTSIGTYNGISVRVQQRIVNYASTFPVSGLMSLTNLDFDTNKPSAAYDGCPGNLHPPCPPVWLNGNFEANGVITIGGSATPNEDVINGSIGRGPNATISLKDSIYTCPAAGSAASTLAYPGKTTVCSIPAVQSGNYAPSAGAKLSDYTSTATNNNDAALNAANPGKTPYVSSSRTFVVSNSNSSAAAPITIPTGFYNFCSFSVKSGYVQIPAGAQVTIYIDNSTTGDGCSSGNSIDGQLYMPSAGMLNMNSNPATLTINVCGDVSGESGACGPWSGAGPCSGGSSCTQGQSSQKIGLVTLNDDLNSTGGPSGNGMTYGDIYAPDSAYTTTGNGLRWTGGLVAGNWESNDNDWIQAAPGYMNNPTLSFYPVAYHVCSVASGSDITLGCY